MKEGSLFMGFIYNHTQSYNHHVLFIPYPVKSYCQERSQLNLYYKFSPFIFCCCPFKTSTKLDVHTILVVLL